MQDAAAPVLARYPHAPRQFFNEKDPSSIVVSCKIEMADLAMDGPRRSGHTFE